MATRRKTDAESLVIEEPPRKVLRLRQSVDESQDFSSLDVNDTSSVQTLSRIEKRLHRITDFNELIVSLLEKLGAAKTMMVRCKLVELLRKIVAHHQVDCSYIAEEVCKHVNQSDSHQFKTELLSLCSLLAPHLGAHSKHFITIMNIAKQGLKDRSSSLKAMSLITMSDVIKHGTRLLFEDRLGMQLLIIDFVKDPEPRVRSVALEVLSRLHESGVVLEPAIYEQASHALYDDYERVRTAALQLVASLAVSTPHRLVKSQVTSQPLPALDDGFAKVCDAINDLSFIVRTQAAKLMANFVGVSQGFLEQTLDKKLMSNMRRKQSAHERQREFYSSGEWSSGKKFADDAPKESVAEESVSLISMGACGAFVHALEDEFMEVREAAVESMCVLAMSNPSYARQTQDFLVDMFNDEIEEVRLQAIHALCKIAQHLCLRDDQVEIISGTLKDYGSDIRTGIHRLIQGCKIATQSGLRDMILALLDNMRKYPEDKRSIWRVMKELGVNHPGLVSPLLPELLSIDPHFDMPEPNMADDCYVAVMIAVYNAASKEHSLISLFPSHTERHYRFHRSRFPHLIPIITLLEQDEMMGTLAIKDTTVSAAYDGSILSDIENQLSRVSSCNNESARAQLLSLCLRDLKHMNSKDGANSSAVSHYLCDYIQCLILFHKIEKQRKAGDDKLVLSLTSQVMSLCERLLNLYSSVPSSTVDMVRQFQLLSLTVCLAKKMETNCAQADDFERYLRQLSKIKKQLNDEPGESGEPGRGGQLSSVSRILDIQETLEAGNWSILQSALSNLNLNSLPLPQSVSTADILRIQCELDEPKTRSDNPKKFTAGLAVCLQVRAALRNCPQNAQIYVKVLLPDQSEVISPVKSSHISHTESDPDNAAERMLKTRVVFSHGHWSESSYVEVCILMKTESLEEMIEICEYNKVYITTKLEKKAHVGNII